MSNPFTITIRLQQHSPLIHFQHHQAGATLRATELKPKLDKFIIDKCFGKDFAQYKKYLVEHDEKKYEKLKGQEKQKYEKEIHEALDYKIKIQSPEVEGKAVNHSLFFGNIGKKEEDKVKYVSVPPNEDIELEILCFRGGLIENIKSYLPGFFASTNFGTRQDKGFGSFYISERDPSFNKDILAILSKGTSFIEINSTDDSTVFSTIAYYYKRLKSGINPNYNSPCKPGYQKAYLYKYLDAKHNYTWEKRWIKETFFGLTPDSRNKKFARALLGLPGSYSFLATDEPCNPDNKNKARINRKSEIEVRHKEIARIQSPLTFKIIKDFKKRMTRVFILLNTGLIEKINREICTPSTRFDFKLKFTKKSDSIPVPGKMIDVADMINSYHDKELGHKIKAFFENKNLEAQIKTI
jgi:hypothetical protein